MVSLKVEFMKNRSLDYWLNSYWEEIIFDFKKRRLEPSDLQDSLYQLKLNHQTNRIQ